MIMIWVRCERKKRPSLACELDEATPRPPDINVGLGRGSGCTDAKKTPTSVRSRPVLFANIEVGGCRGVAGVFACGSDGRFFARAGVDCRHIAIPETHAATHSDTQAAAQIAENA